jgi:hypothetical protein
MPNQSRQCVILTKKSAECAENRSGREDTKGRRPSRPVCPSLFLRYPPPKKMKKRKILLPHLLGGGGYLLGRDWYLVGILVQLDWSLTNNLGVRGTN